MATDFESGVGKAILHAASDHSVELGRLAAAEALSQITHFQPSLALAFISPELEIPEVTKGIIDVLGDCPLIGTSTAGEIANGFFTGKRNEWISHGCAHPFSLNWRETKWLRKLYYTT